MIILRLSPVLAAVLLFLLPGVVCSQADYETAFRIPPYGLDQTVIGIDGWDYRLPTSTDRTATARVVAVRWNTYQPAMMMKGANLKNAFPPTHGEKVKITFDLAVTFPDMAGTGKQFRLGFFGAPCGEIFMDLSGDGGLGYQADGSGRGGVVALKKSDVKNNTFYTFSVSIDYPKSTYSITITGRRKDGSPFRYAEENVPFVSKSKAVSGMYILSGGSLTAWLGTMAIRSETE